MLPKQIAARHAFVRIRNAKAIVLISTVVVNNLSRNTVKACEGGNDGIRDDHRVVLYYCTVFDDRPPPNDHVVSNDHVRTDGCGLYDAVVPDDNVFSYSHWDKSKPTFVPFVPRTNDGTPVDDTVAPDPNGGQVATKDGTLSNDCFP